MLQLLLGVLLVGCHRWYFDMEGREGVQVGKDGASVEIASELS